MEVKIDADKLWELSKRANTVMVEWGPLEQLFIRKDAEIKVLSDENERLLVQIGELEELNNKLRTELKIANGPLGLVNREWTGLYLGLHKSLAKKDKEIARLREQRTNARRNFNEALDRARELYESCARSTDYVEYSASELDPANEE